MNYYEMVSKVRQFSVDSGIAPWELQRIAKQMCCCGTCKYFVEHYAKERLAVLDEVVYKILDWGHCDKGNVQHSKKRSTQSCSSWEERP